MTVIAGVHAAQQSDRAGLIAQASIRRVINDGDGFTPLKRATLLARTRKRAYAWWGIEDGAGLTHDQKMAIRKSQREEIMSSLHPLVDTGSMRNAINYVIEDNS